jgi:outer membrane protein TolC
VTEPHVETVPVPVQEPAPSVQRTAAFIPPSVLPQPVARYSIDLETTLGLAGAENPTIALAREAVQASLAQQMQADAELLPTLDAGFNLNEHWGGLESAQGILLDVNRQALYVGAGAAAVGAGTVGIPGVHLTAQIADAFFDPIAARGNVTARRFDAAATRNAILLGAVNRYFDLVGAEARLQALRESERELAEVARLTTEAARAKQGREGDANRARSKALLYLAQDQRLQEEIAVIGADLARILNFDPAVRLEAPGGSMPLIQLIHPDARLEELLAIALANHPEIAARSADVAVIEAQWRRERVRPFVPFVSVGFSAGEFGGGSDLADRHFGHFDGRTDFDAMLVWSLENLGMGNLARQRRQRALMGQASAERLAVIDRVRREVADAYALTAARRRELDAAQRQLAAAGEGFRLDLRRIRNVLGLPIETLNSLDLLNDARQRLVEAVIGYDQAQFQLYVALGQPPVAPVATPPQP